MSINAPQPKTIAELEKWYQKKKLPSYQFTRFFIGVNYKKARAYGICQDEKTGNFIVYSNDSAGKRTLVYDGTDEKAAVAQFYKRISDELEKQNALTDKQAIKKEKEENPGMMKQAFGGFGGFVLRTLKLTLIYLVATVALLALFIGGAIFFSDNPADGYYQYEDTMYYYSYQPGEREFTDWFQYLSEESKWSDQLPESDVPADLLTKNTAKPYFIDDDWNDTLSCADFATSDYYQALAAEIRK